MRKISRIIVEAFIERETRGYANTVSTGDALYLRGNKIAWHNPDGSISMTLAGHPTPTTRERLNALCLVKWDTTPFHQKDHVQYHNDSPITPTTVLTVHDITTTPVPEGWPVAHT